MLRILGYASVPHVLSILSLTPGIGSLISLPGAIWPLVASFVGTREALDLDTTNTLVTVVIGIVIRAVQGIGGLTLGAADSILRGR
jgi:hypothetical protein